MSTLSRKSQLFLAIGVQGLGALVVLGSNALLLTRYGGASYQRIATLLSIFIAANYFDLGYLGKVRVIAASTQIAPADKRRLAGLEFWRFSGRIALFELGLAAVWFIAGRGSEFLSRGAVALAVAPLVIHVNAFRAFLEGSGDLIASSVLRTAFGILVGVSPFCAVWLLGDLFAFPYVVATVACILTAGFYGVAIGTAGWGRAAATAATLPRAGTIAALETIYILFGAAFLYGDRFALLALENSARAGTYVFVLELVSRVSLLYVPIVMQGFPRLVQSIESAPQEAHAFARRLDRKVLGVIGGAMAIGWVAAVALRGHLPATVDWQLACVLAFPLALAYTLNASSYLHQRFTIVAHDRPRAVLIGYAALLALTAIVFLVLYRQFGVLGVAIAFLFRAAGENLFLRRILRDEQRRNDVGNAP